MSPEVQCVRGKRNQKGRRGRLCVLTRYRENPDSNVFDLKKNKKLFTQSGSDSLLYFLVDDLRCKKTVDEHGIHWEVGVTGMVYYALCPENYVGQ